MTSVTRNARSDWIDAMRGIGISLVVIGHAIRGIDTAGLDIAGVYHLWDVRLYATHVQILFFVSGLLVVQSLSIGRFSKFLTSRLTMILWPMILWTYVFFAVKILASSHQNQSTGLELLATPPVPGYAHLWFLWALFQIGIIFALAFKLLRMVVTAPQIVIAVIFVFSYALSMVPLGSHASYWFGAAFPYLPFFSLGALVTALVQDAQINTRWSVVAAVCFVAIFLTVPSINALCGMPALVSMLLCLAMYFSGPLIEKFPKIIAFLAMLGVASMAIYVMHTIFSAGVREMLMLAGVTHGATQLAIGIFVGIAGPIGARLLAQRFKLDGILRI